MSSKDGPGLRSVHVHVEQVSIYSAQIQMKRFKPRTIRLMGRLHAWLWRLTRGRFVDAVGAAPFLLLITKGRKTGRLRTTPVLYLENGIDLIVVASFGGNDMHPAWYLNLKQYPEAEVVIGGERRKVIAQEVTTNEKKLIWLRLVKLYPQFDAYQQRTSREIPLVRLTVKT
jgi:F420H(2)-dependent quinone reductase